MNKFLKYFIIFIVAVSVCSCAVIAGNLEEHDFDGNFKASIPSGANFDDYKENNTIIYADASNELFILFAEVDNVDDNTIDLFYQGFTQDGTFKKTDTDGNLTLFDINNDNMGKYGAGVNGDEKVVIVCGNDLNLVKEIAKSVDF